MEKAIAFGEIGGREWLTYNRDGREGRFAFPPVQGTHRSCYQAMKTDGEIVPAERLDLAVLAQGAYTQNTPRWKQVKANCFVSRWVRTPMRTLWVPHGNDLAGVLLERDLEGEGRTTKMQLPKDISGWKKGDNGIYLSPEGNRFFVPEGSYTLGEHTINSLIKDGFATAALTEEGAERFAKTAVDAKLKSWTWGYDIKEITNPEQAVVDLDGDVDWLYLDGYSWSGSDGGYAFGVAKTGEASA